MQQTEVGLGNHVTSVNTHTTYAGSSPDGVTTEEVVVLGSTQEANDTQLHNQLVDHLLSLSLSDKTLLQVALDKDIKESTNTTEAHGSTVLVLNSSQVTEVGPLDSLASVGSGLAYIEAVVSTHALELLQGIDLICNLLTATYNLLSELVDIDTLVEALLLLNQVSSTIEGDTTVVTDDTTTTVGIGQTSDNVSVTSSLDIIIVS